MPTIPQVNEAINLPLAYTPSAPPKLVGDTKSLANGIMASNGLLPVGIFLIPLIPFGMGISMVLNRIDAMQNLGAQTDANITQKLLADYNRRLEQATEQREEAIEELYESLKIAKENIIEEYNGLSEQINENENKIKELEKEYNSQLAKYMATITPIAEKAKKAEERGDEEEKEKWEGEIEKYDPWYEEINLFMVDMVNLRLDNILLQMDADLIQPLTKVAIKKDWDYMVGITGPRVLGKFDVPVPYYPDLPDPPNIKPAKPLTNNESCMSKNLKKTFNKWIACPMMPPMGLTVSATLGAVQCAAVKLPPPIAAQMESQADAIKMPLGGIV